MATLKISDIRRDGGTQPRSELREDWAQDYADDMSAGATFPPLVVFYDGTDYWLADGFHRCRAAELAGIDSLSADIRQGSRRDAVLHSVGANGSHGHRRTNQDKRQSVMTLLNDAEWARWSDREIARQCGVGNKFVGDIRRSRTVDRDDERRTYTTRHGTVATMNTDNIGNKPQPVVEQPQENPPTHTDRPPTQQVEPVEPHNHRAQGTGENEWYTPQHYIESARKVMGSIDLDPATSVTAQKRVQADNIFTVEDDGLAQQWYGNVWLNPPYSQPAIMQFMEKIGAEVAGGNVNQAIVLTHNYTDTKWFHAGADAATAICFTRGRIGFLSPSGVRAAPTQGQAFFYYGDNADAFQDEFKKYGFIVKVQCGVSHDV